MKTTRSILLAAITLSAPLASSSSFAQPATVQKGTFSPSAFVDRLTDQKLPDGCTFTELQFHEAKDGNAEFATIGIHQIARDVSVEINTPVNVDDFADGTFKAEYSQDLGGIVTTTLTIQFNKDLSIHELWYSQDEKGQPVPETIHCQTFLGH